MAKAGVFDDMATVTGLALERLMLSVSTNAELMDSIQFYTDMGKKTLWDTRSRQSLMNGRNMPCPINFVCLKVVAGKVAMRIVAKGTSDVSCYPVISAAGAIWQRNGTRA